MATSQLKINNLTQRPIALACFLGWKRQIQKTIPAGSFIDVAAIATMDELNRDAQIQHLLHTSPPSISVTTSDGSDDIPGFSLLPRSGGLKTACRVASTANLTLTNEQTIDGIAVKDGDRVLVKDQTSGAQNGIYICKKTAPWIRSPDCDSSSEVTAGIRVGVNEGVTNGDTFWVLTTDNPITLGTTVLVFGAGVNAALAGGAPADVTKAAASAGVAATASRSDHKHDISVAAPAQGIGGSNGAGTATSLARSDHDHTIRETAGPTNLTVGAVADLSVLQRSGTALISGPLVAVMPISRYTLGADSTLQASIIGATTETIHTALTLAAADLGTARRIIQFNARLHVIAANGADTWTFRVRLGGLAGTLILASAAIDITTNDIYTVSGRIEIRTTGGGGTFDSTARFIDVVNGTAGKDQAVIAGAVDTTGSRTLVVTGTCSTNNAGNQVSLRAFTTEVMSA